MLADEIAATVSDIPSIPASPPSISSGGAVAGVGKPDHVPRGTAGGGRPRPDRSGERFRKALAKEGNVLREGSAAATAPPGGWFLAEGPRGSPRAAVTARPVPTPAIADRILIGYGAEGVPEARIRFATGALAGAEVRLSSIPGQRAIEAQLLTAIAGSRQTLSVAMDEIRLRLRRKGIVLASGRPAGSGSGAGEGADLGARTRQNR